MTLRSSGILLHPASLPGPFGVGDLGPQAFRFLDFLHQAKQHVWQMLPLNPTRSSANHSPYYCPSTFAGDPLLISPEVLCRQGWLKTSECAPVQVLSGERIDFETAAKLKKHLLVKAVQRLLHSRQRQALTAFCRRHKSWLDDHALFTVLNRHFKNSDWCDWPSGLRDRDPGALAEARKTFAAAILHEQARQLFFFQQWRELKHYSRKNGVRLFGDMPIYVPLHSADVWTHQHCFKLGADRRPRFVSGVPPDYFSETGQLWGHPVYDWDKIRADGYGWWMRRFTMYLNMFDLVRIDHFRGLVAYWQVPAEADTALPGDWQPAPAAELLVRVQRRFGDLPFVAEDLGTIDAQVREIMRQFRLPGMRVLQFAFGDDFPCGAFLPHNHVRTCVAYTGTHDNNTTLGWFRREASASEKNRFFEYIGRKVDAATAVWEMIRMAQQSVADTVVIPMQDILGLDEQARMNHPARPEGSWRWRLTSQALEQAPVQRLAEITKVYGRSYPD